MIPTSVQSLSCRLGTEEACKSVVKNKILSGTSSRQSLWLLARNKSELGHEKELDSSHRRVRKSLGRDLGGRQRPLCRAELMEESTQKRYDSLQSHLINTDDMCIDLTSITCTFGRRNHGLTEHEAIEGLKKPMIAIELTALWQDVVLFAQRRASGSIASRNFANFHAQKEEAND